MSQHSRYFASTAKGMELILADELTSIGAAKVKDALGGVYFEGDMEMALRACLWSRLANRILMPLASYAAQTPEELYDGAIKIDWSKHFDVSKTFAIDASIRRSKINHSRYAEQVIKDAIVDQFKDNTDERPNVQRDQPDIRINAYINQDRVTLSLDLSGDSLHRRHYRAESVEAPLKENLAAAILTRAGWAKIAADGGALYDPMCGSGTFLTEAAMMAADIAPGLLRDYYGFLAWAQFSPSIWQRLINEAQYRREQGLQKLPPIMGSDISIKHVGIAKANIKAAQLTGHIKVISAPLTKVEPDTSWKPGLFVVNPPYGERLGDIKQLATLYQDIGTILKTRFDGWHATVFTGNTDLAFNIPLKSHKSYQLYNGAIECKVFNFLVQADRYYGGEHLGQQQQLGDSAKKALLPTPGEWSDGATMFANRLQKNLKKLKSWLNKNDIHCYRLYDADLPEYAVAIDIYQGEKTWVHVQEYEAPKTVDEKKSIERLRDALAVIPSVLGVPPQQVSLKVRRRQKGSTQYEKQDTAGGFHRVQEGNAAFLVNLKDYLDTGLFLDHRPIRQWIAEQAKGKQFLNLFAYTGAVTVHAALAGATGSTTVDMSKTYLDWAKNNFELNNIDLDKHQLVRANCMEWLDTAIKEQQKYELIFIDPPTFSNSKRMDNVFDIQRDYVELLNKAAQLLTKKGTLIFSTNFRKFKFDDSAFTKLQVKNISAQTIAKDFERNPRIHYCWALSFAPND
ncbi:MAG: bifunctional 23S rRNA (guanine(2069)-N(7))-methyltransferase RlmK/23S rRNA (guanine(2445)-N(2))-methyltransferase RlmL [Cycloclasticus sp.]|nr:bifunctional 23S rRNA (guanine(2069)-N(7))-methyltransferase RlmK/23S rRNA (guanine(2445)-N(2))-methyltransferase RlmL [Cycloclasticus sp.]MBQ0790406.1 bifunctional 23S rRNA (guanine(2069)-N(7))-methyltransferase RlmK/23S rRNA (guanine(2445)-N(2))-methyltransferase RlmL [Cycloclasticus sp.]